MRRGTIVTKTNIIIKVTMRDYKTSRFTKRIAITEDDYNWINQNKGKKSAAGFLEAQLVEIRKPNLFKKTKK